jgi:endonuclease/exonuclease/phosphatase family metal-dependent hydrolase
MARIVKNQEENPAPRRKKSIARTSPFLLRLNMLLCFFTLVVYYSSTVRPETFWISGFTVFLIPVLQFLLFLFLLFWLSRKPFFAIFSILTLLLGFRFIESTFGWHWLKTEPCKQFKVMSFNAKSFGGMEKKANSEICDHMIQAFINSKADILCIQEMFNNPNSKKFNVVGRLKSSGFKYVYYSKAGTMKWGASVGMAICSKYPILSRKIIRKKDGSNNQIIKAKIDVEGQTLVVVNMHLQSFFIKEDELNPKKIKENFWQSISTIASKLKYAFKARTQQIDLLLASTLDEELPVIIAGDMNDTPYSNAYLRLRDSFQNGFEEKGSGFGITYNGRLPFLRIDNQFANKRLRFTRFKVDRNISGSDHFPTEACYDFVKAD